MAASDIPGYLQGHVFRNETAYYDSGAQAFKDQAGFDARPGARVVTLEGSPNFQTVDTHDGILLDNQWHGAFKSPIAWQGSMILVTRPLFLAGSGTHNTYPWWWGDGSGQANKGKILFRHFGGNRQLRVVTIGSGVATVFLSNATDSIWVTGFALDQNTRKGYSTEDGSTVNETSAVSGTTNGNDLALSQGAEGCVMGSLAAAAGNTTANTDLNIYVFEQHFFAGNIFVDHASEAETFIGELRTTYGVT